VSSVQTGIIETRIPSRLDRLPWSRFHWRIVFGLGTAWVLDGLEVTIVASVASRMTQHGSGIHIGAGGIGIAAALYVAGACSGALFFGELTDRFGRKKLFMVTLGVYMVSTAITAVSFFPIFFYIFRFLTGTGIGGEYAAINSAIDELIPARARGGVDLIINGSYWVGSIIGSALAIFFLDTTIFPVDVGWRLTFAIGLVLGTVVLLVRRHVPESPRWLFIHGREQEAEAVVGRIEAEIREETGAGLEPVDKTLTVRQRKTIGFGTIARTAIKVYPKRSILCIALFVGQAFIYNGITFNLGTLMGTFFHVASGFVPVFIIIFAASNFLGPLALGRLFDTVGRIPMITGTYLGSAALGLLLAGLFIQRGLLGQWTFIIVLIATFFLASAGASAAYLTSSEIFPMETRALAIAFFYAIGTAVGGITGPLLFGPLIATKARDLVGVAFLIGSVLMGAGGISEVFFGVKAEQAQLEDIAKPLTAEEAEREQPGRGAPVGAGVAGRGVAKAPLALEAQRARQQSAEERARAALERARAAEHRALAHEHLASAAAGDEEAARRAETESVLAEAAQAMALAHEERAVAADERATLDGSDRAGGGPMAGGEPGPGDPGASAASGGSAAGEVDRAARGEPAAGAGRAAAGHRARAAEHRARSHEQEAQALTAGDEQEEGRHGALAAAALERGREAEQLALAAEGGEERAAMHEAWATMHAERARAYEAQARGEHASLAWRAAEVAAERARAIAFRVEAAQHRAEAEDERREGERAAEAGRRRAEEVEQGEREALQEAERRAAREAAEARVRARLELRRRREAGFRRYLPGPGRLGTPPGITALPPFPEEALDNEIMAIERAVQEHGPTERGELARLLGARYWGPGVFAEALRQAVAEGSVRRLSWGIYGPPEDAAGRGRSPG
jgi:MFS family permease